MVNNAEKGLTHLKDRALFTELSWRCLLHIAEGGTSERDLREKRRGPFHPRDRGRFGHCQEYGSPVPPPARGQALKSPEAMRPKPRPRRASKCQGTLGGTQAPQAPALTLAGKPDLKVYDSLLGLEHPWPNPAACVPPTEACSNGDRGRRPAQRDRRQHPPDRPAPPPGRQHGPSRRRHREGDLRRLNPRKAILQNGALTVPAAAAGLPAPVQTKQLDM